MVAFEGRTPLVCVRQRCALPLSNIRTTWLGADTVTTMEPACAGVLDDDQLKVWSAVLRPAAVELAERAGEIAAVVNTYTSERLPELLASAQALEVNRASTEASIRDFAEVLLTGADPAEAVRLGSPTLAYAQDGAQHGIPLTTLMR